MDAEIEAGADLIRHEAKTWAAPAIAGFKAGLEDGRRDGQH